MFTCIECGQKTKERDRVYVGTDWCFACVDKENQRSMKEDVNGPQPWFRSRPPKYMLDPKDYARFGYK